MGDWVMLTFHRGSHAGFVVNRHAVFHKMWDNCEITVKFSAKYAGLSEGECCCWFCYRLPRTDQRLDLKSSAISLRKICRKFAEIPRASRNREDWTKSETGRFASGGEKLVIPDRSRSALWERQIMSDKGHHERPINSRMSMHLPSAVILLLSPPPPPGGRKFCASSKYTAFIILDAFPSNCVHFNNW